jgi:hypothetical protein
MNSLQPLKNRPYEPADPAGKQEGPRAFNILGLAIGIIK